MQLQKHRCFQIIIAYQGRNFEAWGTSLEIAFSKKSSGDSFFIEKNDPTEDIEWDTTDFVLCR
jgi:uncharacterized protein YeaC (DUF1315 family)